MTEAPELTVYEKAFVKTDKTDAILVVDGYKMHVNKAATEEIEIKNVFFENFATLLSLIQDNPLEIGDSRMVVLLNLADQFLLPAAKRHVELSICSTQIGNYRKLKLADNYNLEVLLKRTILLFKEKADFEGIWEKAMLQKMAKTPELRTYEKAFAKSDKTDAILVVDGKKLHVNKALLSYHSDYFYKLFNSEFKEKSMKEIEIEDVDFENFATLLSLVQEEPLEITRKNVEDLLILADRFLLNAAKFAVENFIKISNEISRHEKLLLADRYKLEKLLKYTFGLYASKKSFYDFWHEGDRKFSDDLKVKLFDYFFDKFAHELED